MQRTWLVLAGALAPAACGKSVKGTYNMVNGPSPGVVATFGDKTFSLFSGASGIYEASGDTVILSGMSLTGSYKIDGDKLVGDRFTFVRRDPGDKSSINQGPRGGSFDHATGASSTLVSGKN
ncbi:hypothetical protein U1872_21530 [Sphingomonas sp. RB3P16]|uniref:hypothetical protein n=1 Tax=Parasphingomonas frigoris TaxID=3096163 RepID=UPI002FC66091